MNYSTEKYYKFYKKRVKEMKQVKTDSEKSRNRRRTSFPLSAEDFQHIIRKCQKGDYTNARLLEEYNSFKREADRKRLERIRTSFGRKSEYSDIE